MKKKAIFLDRDGVLVSNSDHYYIWKQEQLQWVDEVFENLLLFIQEGFQLFIVSNQGGISKGLYTKPDVLKFHDELAETFRENKIEIQNFVFCPHHPEIEKCICRKPEALMIEKLIARYNLIKEDSYLIGDSDSDMEAARNAGIRGIKINPNQNMFPFIAFLIQ